MTDMMDAESFESVEKSIFREAGNTDAIGSGHPVYEALNERIQTLEDFNTKLLAALKQHGFDVVKLFR